MKNFNVDVDSLVEKAKDVGEEVADKAADILQSAKELANTASYRGKDWLKKPTTKNAIERANKSVMKFFENTGEGIKNWLINKQTKD